ncbi:MAG: thioredoxin domain-containing protein [Nitrospirota bacterium]|nr:thioredoxin domain-containing protein [Nitrospirota bacterium]
MPISMQCARTCNLMNKLMFSKGGSFGSLLFFLILFLLVLFPVPSPAAPQPSSLRLLYFFNTSCAHCREIKPFIFDLSKEYKMEGWIVSKQDVKDYPFPVKVGSKEIAPKYHVIGVPSIVVLKNEQFAQLASGAPNIKNIRPLLKALDAGALNVTEAVQKKSGDEIFVTGYIKIQGADANVIIIDHAKRLPVDAWLPREAVKSKFKKTPPRTMSELAGKAVALKGKLVKGPDGAMRLQVREEVRYDKENAAKTAAGEK